MHIVKLAFYLLSTTTTFHLTFAAEGNGNLNALRTTPYDEVIPIPYYLPPAYIDDRIQLLIRHFFKDSRDQAEAQEMLQTIWYYNPVYAMLAMIDQMSRHQYVYAEYGDECFDDSFGDENHARITQQIYEANMRKPTSISAGPYFFMLDGWWEILENTVINLWRENMILSTRICDFRGKRLICGTNSNKELRCTCPVAANGVQLMGRRGGVCGIEAGKTCDYLTASRREARTHAIEVFHEGEIQKSCLGNSFCTKDKFNNETTCHCWPILRAEERGKRTVLFNTTVEGAWCNIEDESEDLKWGKWNVALSIVYISIFLVIFLTPHWDDICFHALPSYYKRFASKKSHVPRRTTRESHCIMFLIVIMLLTYIEMDPDIKDFIDKNAVTVDINDPNYYESVDAVDRNANLDIYERFVNVSQCANESCTFEWPTVTKHETWF